MNILTAEDQAMLAESLPIGVRSSFPKDADKAEFYQHDRNWTNRMTLGGSLQVPSQ